MSRLYGSVEELCSDLKTPGFGDFRRTSGVRRRPPQLLLDFGLIAELFARVIDCAYEGDEARQLPLVLG